RELRIIARKQLRSERPDHSLQVTILVDDTLLELLGANAEIKWENRRHFYRTAAKKIRNLLIDHERKRRAQRRGGGEFRRVSLDLDQLSGESTRIDLLALDQALTKLAAIDQRQSDIVELHHFGGCSVNETAQILDVSPSTIKNEWRFAKAWLHRELTRDKI
ncbi:MAG: ECF-type sigma factor, partial [Pirellulaceae bacterium]